MKGHNCQFLVGYVCLYIHTNTHMLTHVCVFVCVCVQDVNNHWSLFHVI